MTNKPNWMTHAFLLFFFSSSFVNLKSLGLVYSEPSMRLCFFYVSNLPWRIYIFYWSGRDAEKYYGYNSLQFIWFYFISRNNLYSVCVGFGWVVLILSTALLMHWYYRVCAVCFCVQIWCHSLWSNLLSSGPFYFFSIT